MHARLMTPNHVLCPIDGSAASSRALYVAAAHARAFDLPLRVLSAVEDPHQIGARRAEVEFLVASIDAPSIEIVVALCRSLVFSNSIVRYVGV